MNRERILLLFYRKIWARSVAVNTSACHAEDRRFEPGRARQNATLFAGWFSVCVILSLVLKHGHKTTTLGNIENLSLRIA